MRRSAKKRSSPSSTKHSIRHGVLLCKITLVSFFPRSTKEHHRVFWQILWVAHGYAIKLFLLRTFNCPSPKKSSPAEEKDINFSLHLILQTFLYAPCKFYILHLNRPLCSISLCLLRWFWVAKKNERIGFDEYNSIINSDLAKNIK